MTTKEITIQQIMLHEVIFSRKAAIDQFQEGLGVLNFYELLFNFPQMCEPLFVCSSACHSNPTPDRLCAMLRCNPSNADQDKTYTFLRQYVASLGVEGESEMAADSLSSCVQTHTLIHWELLSYMHIVDLVIPPPIYKLIT